MQRTKKIISALLAIVMLVSVFSVNALAGAPAPTDGAKTIIAYELCDESGNLITQVSPGQTVTLNVYFNASVANDQLVNFLNSVYFDGSVYEYIAGSVKWLGVAGWIDAANSQANALSQTNSNKIYTTSAGFWTAEEKAAHPNWTSFVYVTGVQLKGAATYLVQENADSPAYSLKFKVLDTAEAGANADFGCPASVNFNSRKTYQSVRTVNTGTIGAGEIAATPVYTVSVAGGEVSAPVLTKGRAQYKMETLVPGVSVADNFQYRVLSTISKADWEAHFENTAVEGATTKALTEVGFIAADTATFDLNTAKTAVIANTTGDYTTGLPAGYKAATTNHIYRTDGDATFACRVDTSKDTCADLTYIAFAKYLDADGQPQVIFYDEAATVLLKSSYDDLVNRWLGR